jgi:putative nucleotidyltransferase with HDIG domain
VSGGHPRACRAYVATIVAVGAVPLLAAIRLAIERPLHPGWLLLAALSLLSGPLAVRIPSISATISVSEGFIFAAGLLFGPPAAIVTAVLDGLGVSLWNRQRLLRRTLFNVAEPAVSVWLAMWLFYEISGTTPLLHRSAAILPLLAPLLTMTVSYFLLNTMLLATAVWLENGTSPFAIVRKHLSHLALDFCVSLSLAAVIVQTSANVTVAAIVVLVPMLLASYLSSHYVAGQLEETDRHLAELRRLYDSTVETLAMAVDAKDQITHGHIRRVQVLSDRLAQAVGAPEEEIRALEAAALLHDLGKLAIPEHILNKPGPLTAAEYEQMKTHAAIGAEILSRIEFPFPVVPIVRHHHENWDGTGYPDRLKEAQIPIGARILAVVDCYDALTSDRPYRRKMRPEDALEIIRKRAGQMYDPAVVDAFVIVHATAPLEPRAAAGDEAVLPLRLAAVADRPVPPRRPVAKRTLPERRQGVYDFAGRMRGAALRELAGAVIRFFTDAQPNVATAVYRFDPDSQHLVLVDGSESLMGVVLGLVPLGSGVTGWVGSNRTVMLNADASLDVGDASAEDHPTIRMCAAAPILHEGELAGVLSLYSSCAFSEADRLVLEVMAEELGPLLARAAAGHNGSPAPALVRSPWATAVGE